MKINKKIIISIITIMMFLLNTYTFAANLNLNVDFDGKTIEMTSETPEMKWQIKNIAPGKNYSTTIIINSIGSKEVKVEYTAEIIDGREYEEYITIKIENSKSNEKLRGFKTIEGLGKYKDFQNIVEKISSKETKAYTVTVTLPEEINDKFENKTCTIKFNFTAKGEKNAISVSNQQEMLEQVNTQENKTEEITTNTIKEIKASQSYVIFIVLGILATVLIVLVIMFIKTRK